MLDIHNHILYDVDDGSRTMDESIALIIKAKEVGITGIVLTPHYMKGAMDTDVAILKERFNVLNQMLKDKNIDMPLYLGHELYLDPLLIEDLEDKKCMSMNNSKYVLMELPMKSSIHQLEAFVFELKIAGYTPILAHPERYAFVQGDINNLKKLIDEGVLIQLNLSSLNNYYGSTVRKVARKIIKKRWVHFIGTDVHRANSASLDIKKPIKYIKSKAGKTFYNQISLENPQAVINNKDLAAVTKKKPRKWLKRTIIIAVIIGLIALAVNLAINKVENQFEAIMIEQGKAYRAEKLRQEAEEAEKRADEAEAAKLQREAFHALEKDKRDALREAEDLAREEALKEEELRLLEEERLAQEAIEAAENEEERLRAEAAAAALRKKQEEDRLAAEEEAKEIEAARLEEERLAQAVIDAQEARIEAERLEVERLLAEEKAREQAALEAEYRSYDTDKVKAMDLALSKLSVAQVNELIRMSSGGFTADERAAAKVMFYNNFTGAEQEWILEMYALYYGG